MKIGIIGAGQIGSTLTRRLTTVGHEVFVANSRGPETLAQLAKETGAHAVTPHEAARAGKVIVVSIPQIRVRELQKDLFAGVPPWSSGCGYGQLLPAATRRTHR